MSYCRYCGKDITYKRTKNERWLPCDALTGEAHFCQKNANQKIHTGILVCKKCGKPVFKNKTTLIDYTTLQAHVCKKGDITRYEKYKAKMKN